MELDDEELDDEELDDEELDDETLRRSGVASIKSFLSLVSNCLTTCCTSTRLSFEAIDKKIRCTSL